MLMALAPETFRFAERFQRAEHLADLKQDYLAACIGKDPSQFSRELRKFSDFIDRLINTLDEPTFWTALLLDMAAKAGVSVAVDVEGHVRIALTKCAAACVDASVALGHRRMAKADHRSTSERRTA